MVQSAGPTPPNIRPVHPGDVKRSRVSLPFDNSPIPIPSGVEWAEDQKTGWYPYVKGATGTFVPLLTSTGTQPSLGSTGISIGKYSMSGNWCLGDFYMEFGSGGGATPGTGEYQIEGLPFDVDLGLDGVDYLRLGCGTVTMVQGAAQRLWRLTAISRTQLKIRDESGNAVTNAVPWAWAGGNSFRGLLTYPAVLR
jgi:hypothetical protein